MPADTADRSPALAYALAAVCFFLSGAAALLYEVVWVRLLGLVFGHTVHAVTAVLAAYMAGLALGSAAAGRLADRIARPLRAYGIVEAAIGVLCLATPLLFRATQAVYDPIQRALEPGALGSGLIHLALASLVLLPPTVLMGATLPILSRAVVRGPRTAASRIGTLYAVNTLGAVVGTAATGFLLLPAVGLRSTLWLGVALDFLVAALAISLDRARRAAPAANASAASAPAGGEGAEIPWSGEAAPPPLPRAGVAAALVGIGLSGAASMAYEVAWTRALGLVLGSTTYAFTAMLVTFLSGLALGALLASRLLGRRRADLSAFGLLEIAIALAALSVLPAFGRLPDLLLSILGRAGVTHQVALLAQLGLSFLVMIGPTLLVGATFPLVLAAVGTSLSRVGRDVGHAYGANTVGTILGSTAAGFLLVPAIGIEATVVAAGVANLAAGLAALAVAPGAGRRLRLAGVAAAAGFAVLVLLLPRWDPNAMTAGVPVYAAEMVKDPRGFRASQRRREILLYREGLSSTVAVVRTPTAISLSVNGKTDASTGQDMGTQLLLGHLGALLHPEPRRALVIGLASGVTVGAVAQHPLDAIDVAEIEPAMVEASRFFLRENRGALSDPRVRVIEGDGRHILAAAREPYDLVVSEPSNPWMAGVASLFTREFYQTARDRLAPGGIMVQWLQTYSIFGRDMQMVVRTFSEVFPHVSVWAGARGDVLLLATPATACLDLDLVERRLAASPGLREDFERLGLGGGRLAFRLVLDEEDTRRYAAGAPLNTDDLPLLEFSAPRGLYAGSAVENEALLRSFRRADRPCLRGTDPAGLAGPSARLEAARAHLREGKPEDADLELSRMGPPAALDPDLRIERARLLFAMGSLEAAWAEMAGPGGIPAAVRALDVHRRALFALADPALGPRVQAALRRLPGGWYADPAAFGELILALSIERGDPSLVPLALEQLERAARLAPGRASVQVNLGVCLAKLDRPDEAARSFGRALELDPGDARTHFNLGMLQERRGLLEEAIRHYAEAARLEPGWPGLAERVAALRASVRP
ncbi:MAG TPA: fused MFS/spermidine synthase [Anaeromyxobacteraceae bacterium]|nr:fused MFS/spermidine synthase [Anaeromyxobacteraceae bacterium]